MNTSAPTGTVLRLKPALLVLIFASVITAGLVFPYLIHRLGGASLAQALLPIPFIVLLAGSLFGWEVGLVSGLAIPLTSYIISGMPALPILPRLMFEFSLSGFLVGWYDRKLRLGVFPSILLAVLSVRSLSALFFPGAQNNWALFLKNVEQGFPGLLLQVVLLPLLIVLIRRFITGPDR